MRELSWDDFADAVGNAYVVDVEGQPVEVALDRVVPLPPTGRSAGSFRLEFLGPLDAILQQAIYPFSGGGDSFEIFIVPVAREAGGIRYEAIFN